MAEQLTPDFKLSHSRTKISLYLKMDDPVFRPENTWILKVTYTNGDYKFRLKRTTAEGGRKVSHSNAHRTKYGSCVSFLPRKPEFLPKFYSIHLEQSKDGVNFIKYTHDEIIFTIRKEYIQAVSQNYKPQKRRKRREMKDEEQREGKVVPEAQGDTDPIREQVQHLDKANRILHDEEFNKVFDWEFDPEDMKLKVYPKRTHSLI